VRQLVGNWWATGASGALQACMYVCMYVCMYAYEGRTTALFGLGTERWLLGEGGKGF
jgi:hypothetical protein